MCYFDLHIAHNYIDFLLLQNRHLKLWDATLSQRYYQILIIEKAIGQDFNSRISGF